MDIKADKFTLVLTYDELWNIAFDVKRALEKSINEHWVHYQDSWRSVEDNRIGYCKDMFIALGRPELMDIEDYAERTFEAFNDAKLKKREQDENELLPF